MSEPTVLSFLVTVDATGDPKLYADLVRFRKGKPRVQRMRVLALQGVLAEGSAPTQGARPSKPVAAMGAVFGEPDEA